MADLTPNNLNERQLRRAIWLTEHRLLFRKIGIGALWAIAVGSWTFTIGVIVYYLVIAGPALREQVRVMTTTQNESARIIAQQRPRPLEIADVLLIPSGSGRYDAGARVVNANPKWLVDIEYVLTVPGATVETAHAVLLPGRDRWLSRLNIMSATAPSQATLTIAHTTWHRVRPQDIPDVERFMRERFNVAIRNPVFAPPEQTTSVPGVPPSVISRATFTVANQSAYHLRDLECTVLLRRNGAVVGVNRIILDELQSGEVRPAAATWFLPLGLVQTVEVIPFVNVFDPASFIAPD